MPAFDMRARRPFCSCDRQCYFPFGLRPTKALDVDFRMQRRGRVQVMILVRAQQVLQSLRHRGRRTNKVSFGGDFYPCRMSVKR